MFTFMALWHFNRDAGDIGTMAYAYLPTLVLVLALERLLPYQAEWNYLKNDKRYTHVGGGAKIFIYVR